MQHISTAWSVELVRRAKRDGQPVTTEVAPHHLLLTDEACRGYDTNFKMNPPLRTKADVDACIAGVLDGTIDILATDHAPHTADVVSADKWDRPYSREQAAYPVAALHEFKFWPAVARVDNVHGDRNLVCSCVGMENYTDERRAAS